MGLLLIDTNMFQPHCAHCCLQRRLGVAVGCEVMILYEVILLIPIVWRQSSWWTLYCQALGQIRCHPSSQSCHKSNTKAAISAVANLTGRQIICSHPIHISFLQLWLPEQYICNTALTTASAVLYRHSGQSCHKDAAAQFTAIHRLLIQSVCSANQISQLWEHVAAGLCVLSQAHVNGATWSCSKDELLDLWDSGVSF